MGNWSHGEGCCGLGRRERGVAVWPPCMHGCTHVCVFCVHVCMSCCVGTCMYGHMCMEDMCVCVHEDMFTCVHIKFCEDSKDCLH